MMIDSLHPHPCPSCQSKAQVVLARQKGSPITNQFLLRDVTRDLVFCMRCMRTYEEEVEVER